MMAKGSRKNGTRRSSSSNTTTTTLCTTVCAAIAGRAVKLGMRNMDRGVLAQQLVQKLHANDGAAARTSESAAAAASVDCHVASGQVFVHLPPPIETAASPMEGCDPPEQQGVNCNGTKSGNAPDDDEDNVTDRFAAWLRSNPLPQQQQAGAATTTTTHDITTLRPPDHHNPGARIRSGPAGAPIVLGLSTRGASRSESIRGSAHDDDRATDDGDGDGGQ